MPRAESGPFDLYTSSGAPFTVSFRPSKTGLIEWRLGLTKSTLLKAKAGLYGQDDGIVFSEWETLFNKWVGMASKRLSISFGSFSPFVHISMDKDSFDPFYQFMHESVRDYPKVLFREDMGKSWSGPTAYEAGEWVSVDFRTYHLLHSTSLDMVLDRSGHLQPMDFVKRVRSLWGANGFSALWAYSGQYKIEAGVHGYLKERGLIPR